MPRQSNGRPGHSYRPSVTARVEAPLRRCRPLPLMLLALASCYLIGARPALAQNVQYTSKSADTGLRSDLKVNPSTHGLELRIPLGEYPGRAGTGLPFALNYSSKVWRMKYAHYYDQYSVNGYTVVYGEHSQAGWTMSPGFPVIDTEAQVEAYDAGGGPTGGECRAGGTSGSPAGTSTCCFIDRVMVRMPDGSTHELRSTDTPVCVNGLGTTSVTPPDDMYAVDESRLRYRKSTNELFLPDGSRYVLGGAGGGGQYVDRNGNVLTYDGNARVWTDTLGRTLPGIMPVGSGTDDAVLSLPGVGASAVSYTLRWRHLSAAGVLSPGEPLSWTTSPSCPFEGSQTHADFLFSGGAGGCVVSHYQFDPVVLYQVVLPTGQAYTFNYDRYGEVAKITYPTGGYERYAYGVVDTASWVSDPYGSVNRGVLDRYVSASGSGADEAHWQYPTGTGGGFQFNQFQQGEIAPDGTLTERLMYRDGGGAGFGYSYGGAMAGMPYEERVWSAPDASGNRQLLRRKLTKWEATGSNATYRPDITINAARNGRVTKEVELLFDTGGGPALAKVTTYEYDLAYEFTTGANQTAVNEYDYFSVDRGTAQTAAVDSFSPPAQWLRRTETDYLDDTNSAYRNRNLLGLKKETRVKDSSGAVVGRTAVAYDQGGVDSCPQVITHDGTNYGTGFTTRGNATGVTSYADAAAMTGAVTTSTHYDEAGNAVSATDANGNTSTVSFADNFSDGNNLRHTYAYPTSGTTARPNPSALTSPSGGSYGSTAGFTSGTAYDFNTGLVTSTTDPNGRTASYDYADPLDRLKRVDLPDGGRMTYTYVDTHQCGAYVETHRLLDDAGREVKTWQYFDGLGRPYLSETYENQDQANPYLRADTRYDTSGRVSQVSSPYRSPGCTAAAAGQWTTSEYDALGRVRKVTTPDGAALSTDYSGNTVTANDQHAAGTPGHPRRSVSDALGRLVRVDEPDKETGALDAGGNPVQPTVYGYDALGNLRTVTQDGGTLGTQTRTFDYDSLSRLTSAQNPESGTISYTYDGNGNLKTRTDARGVQTTYTYDGLNRNTVTSYAGGGTTMPDLYRHYDNPAAGKNGLGRFWWGYTGTGADVVATGVNGYDEVGRVLEHHQNFVAGGASFSMGLQYNKAGDVITETYPSRHTVRYNYDAAGRLGDDPTQPSTQPSPQAFTGNLGDGVQRVYAEQVGYSPFGGVGQERFGTQTPLYHKLHYNRRGQLYDVRLSTQSLQSDEWDWNRGAIVNYYGGNYAWEGNPSTPAGPDNNGNLRRSEAYVPLDPAAGYNGAGTGAYYMAQQTYSYDALNRLGSVTEAHTDTQTNVPAGPFSQLYDYDRWGNRTIDPATTDGLPEPQFAVDVATNRLGAPAGSGKRMDYDAAGNLVNDTQTSYGHDDGTPTRLYDGENRLTTVKNENLQVVSVYTYDADGRRVKRKVGGEEWWQVYGVGGELLAEYRAEAAPYAPSKEYGYRGGELLVTMSSGDDRRLSRFVTYLYYGALRRDPTAQELQDTSNQLAAAGAQGQAQLLATARQVARALFTQTTYETSPYRTETQYVTDLYYAYLQRAPDDSGLAGWAGAAAGGVTNRSNVCDAFQESGEFSAIVSTLYGSATSDDQRTDTFINRFYIGAYGRAATSVELQQWRGSLNAAEAQGLGQTQAAAEAMGRGLFAGQVNDYTLTDEQYVTNLYEGFLQRGPDTGGLNFWTSNASGGPQNRQNVLNAFATCPAFRELSGTLYRETFWLVSDQLGTPRMVADRTGSLAGIKRHDYLPFGEELSAGAGGRTTAQGFQQFDGNRKKWAQLERDDETGLDYAQARYYLNKQGRFTSPDEFTGGPDELYDFVDDAAANPTFYADLTNPQSLNKYQYTYNNPLRYTDPNGHCPGGATAICAEGATLAGGSVAGPVGALIGFTVYVVVDQTVGWDNVAKAVGQNDTTCPECQTNSEKAFGRYYNKDNAANQQQNVRTQDNSGNQNSGENSAPKEEGQYKPKEGRDTTHKTPRQAQREAKRRSGIPTTQTHDTHRKVRDSQVPGKTVVEQDFTVRTSGGRTETRTIRNDRNGHPKGNVPRHFNDTNGGHHQY